MLIHHNTLKPGRIDRKYVDALIGTAVSQAMLDVNSPVLKASPIYCDPIGNGYRRWAMVVADTHGVAPATFIRMLSDAQQVATQAMAALLTQPSLGKAKTQQVIFYMRKMITPHIPIKSTIRYTNGQRLPSPYQIRLVAEYSILENNNE